MDRVRREASPCKVSAEGWLDVCRRWHALGGRGSATMMFGHLETLAERIEHLDRLRSFRTKRADLPLLSAGPSSPVHTALAGLPKAGPFEYLKTLRREPIVPGQF